MIVASGMGHLAERIVEVAVDSAFPSMRTIPWRPFCPRWSWQGDPEELYQAIVDIYIYFLQFDPSDPEKYRRERRERLEAKQAKE